jgi:5-methyltetrahydrofolate--homocysteine methyltransferase
VGVVLACNNYEVIDLGVMVPAEKILQTAIDQKADIIGLSGLITPSLDEMAHVAREMERRGFRLPLLIGGATTSKAHTAIKIAPHYSGPVVHVLDASRAVGVVGSLLSDDLRPAFLETLKGDYAKLREQHGERKGKPLLSISQARERSTPIEWKASDLPQPAFTGPKVLDNVPLAELVPFIDWSPFFHTWELRGRFPSILDNAEAKKLYEDAQRLLQEIVEGNLLRARGVYGFFPANRVGDDVELYTDATRQQVLTRFHFLRQQADKPAGQFNHSLADFIAPKASGLPDHLGAFAVSTGFGTEDLCARFERDLDDYNSIMAKALADRLAEAFAEYLHRQARLAWGYGAGETLTVEDLVREQYRGIRPAAGYPACPDHTEKLTLWSLLGVELSTGIKLTESCAMWPGASVSGLYFAHPESKYFAVGKLGRDQIEDYQGRKGLPLEEVERWLGPWLDYDPADYAPIPAAAGII